MAALRDDERAWIAGAQAGSLPDLEALFREHWPRAYRAAYLVVHDGAAAEDIAQEAMLSAIRTLDRFDRRRPFGPWLHRIVVNRAIDWVRARALRAEAGEPALELAAADRIAEGAPYSQPVLAALGELSPDHRAVIVLRHLLEYTPREIARMLDLPRGTVNSRLRRGPRPARGPARGRRGHDVNAFELRRALLAIPPPDELGATRRSWQLARAAFDEREPTPWPKRHTRGLVAAAVAIAALAAAVSPPGRAVIADVREALGTEKVASSSAAEDSAFLAAGGGTRARHGPDRRLGRRGERLQAAARRLRRGVVVARRTGRRLEPEPARRHRPDRSGPVDTRPAAGP